MAYPIGFFQTRGGNTGEFTEPSNQRCQRHQGRQQIDAVRQISMYRSQRGFGDANGIGFSSIVPHTVQVIHHCLVCLSASRLSPVAVTSAAGCPESQKNEAETSPLRRQNAGL